MDVWVILTNGNVAPLTGVTAIESVEDYPTDVSVPLGSVSWGVGDISKITVASTTGVLPGMRIQAEATLASSTSKDSLPVGTRVLGTNKDGNGNITEIFIDPPFTTATAAASGVGVAIADPAINHFEDGYYRNTNDSTGNIPPRQLTYHRNMWKITCTVNAETIDHYFQKPLVAGFCNSEPTI